jgi:hypothetical protein
MIVSLKKIEIHFGPTEVNGRFGCSVLSVWLAQLFGFDPGDDAGLI